VIPLVRHELKRNLRPVVLVPLLGFFLVLAYEEVGTPWIPEQAQVQGALALHGSWLPLALTFAAGVVGSSLADERRQGIALTSLAKGLTRSRYVIAKVLGAAASGALVTAAGIVGFYVLVGVLWPWGRVNVEGTIRPPGPVPALFVRSPLANDLAAAWMTIAAAAAMPAIGVLAGTLTSNKYIAMATPLLVLLASLVLGGTVLDDTVWTLGLPSVHLDLWGDYSHAVPAAFQPYAAFLYWAGFVIVITAIARWIFGKKELT
jgi:hypothetical protein